MKKNNQYRIRLEQSFFGNSIVRETFYPQIKKWYGVWKDLHEQGFNCKEGAELYIQAFENGDVGYDFHPVIDTKVLYIEVDSNE